MVDLAILVVEAEIVHEVAGQGRHLHILHHQALVHLDPQILVDVEQLAEILPAAGGGKLQTLGGVLDAVEVLLFDVQVGDHRAVQTLLPRVLLPDREVLRHVDALDAVERHHVKVPHGLVVFRRVARGHDQPALGQTLVAEGLVLQKLQHHGGQSLGDAVDLIEE